MQSDEKLVVLCVDLINAKCEETRANEARVLLEREILNLVGCPDEGSTTTEAGAYKIKVDQRIIRKLDEKKWALVKDEIPEQLRPITIVEEYKVEAKGVRWLKDNEPGYYKLLCSAMEEKPAKPAVKVQAI